METYRVAISITEMDGWVCIELNTSLCFRKLYESKSRITNTEVTVVQPLHRAVSANRAVIDWRAPPERSRRIWRSKKEKVKLAKRFL